ncbi:MAG: hypothetical protein JRG77_07735 [Deltaproteobacteria bacterium]|nr:hypothetical protein [Deltaproteobacteria bacterium]
MEKSYSTAADLNKFFAQCNLNMHIRYYNEHKRLVSSQVGEITKELEQGCLDPKRKRDLEHAKHVYLNSYHQHMIINAFLLIYSHLEECLAVTFRLFIKGSPVSKKTGLERFKEDFRDRCSVNLTNGPRWAFLQDCSQIRSTLLHTAGNITLFRNRRKIDPVIKRNPKHVAVCNNRLVLHEQMLVDFSNAIPDFLNWLTDEIEKKYNNAMYSDGNSAALHSRR